MVGPQAHQAASGVTWSPWGLATCGKETAQKQAIGHQLQPLLAMDVSTGPRWPGRPGARLRGHRRHHEHSQQPASAGTAPGVLSLACTASQQAHRPGTRTQPWPATPGRKERRLDSDTAPAILQPCRHLLPLTILWKKPPPPPAQGLCTFCSLCLECSPRPSPAPAQRLASRLPLGP